MADDSKKMGTLSVTRQVGERIYVGKDIIIEVHVIERNRVRLRITAPTDVPIYRDDTYARIHEEGKSDG